jgi:protocatechuate 3,4-dioxygenase beta subunit
VTRLALFLALVTAPAGHAAEGLAGKVLDSSGKPISAATVFVYTAKPRVGLGILCPSCYPDCGKKTITDAEGRFQFAGLNPQLLFRILVVAEGFQPQFAEDVDPLGEPLEVKLQAMPTDLSSRAVLRGRVVDPKGNPVVGAVVSPTGCERLEKRWWGRMPGVDPASVTNLRGEFLITGNPGDLGYDLEVEARGFARRRIDLLPTGEQVHEIKIAEGATVEGRILKAGKPVAGAAVGLVQCDRGHREFVGAYAIATDAQGRYTFTSVHPNDDYFVYTMMGNAERLGGVLLPQKISVGPDGTTMPAGDHELTAAHSISGHIILTDGQPVPSNTRLLLAREEAWDSQTAMVAADGAFRFTGVPEEAVKINARIPGYRLASRRNRFQQVGSSTVAMFVEADMSGIELFFEPEPPR